MCHALIIEDEFLTADLLVSLVEEAGATSTAIAVSEDEAVSAAREHKPAIILSDVRLVEGTGPRAVQRIMAEVGEIPVIFITGTPEECEPCNPPGMILAKPVNSSLLVRKFKELAFGEK